MRGAAFSALVCQLHARAAPLLCRPECYPGIVPSFLSTLKCFAVVYRSDALFPSAALRRPTKCTNHERQFTPLKITLHRTLIFMPLLSKKISSEIIADTVV